MHDALRARVSEILRNPCARRIRFDIRTARVNAGLFERVAAAVTRGAIGVKVNPGVRRSSGGAIDAEYSSVGKHFSFAHAFLRPVFDEALVVHEAVHAGFDLDRVRMPAADDEAAAYIAQCVYLMHVGLEAAPEDEPILAAAWPSAAAVFGGGVVPDELLPALRDVIWQSPGYEHLNADRDREYVRTGLPPYV
jgi:hypothetical protein